MITAGQVNDERENKGVTWNRCSQGEQALEKVAEEEAQAVQVASLMQGSLMQKGRAPPQ